MSVQTSDRKTASPLKKPLERGKSCRVSGEAVAKAFNQVRGPHPSNIRIPMTRQTQSGLFPQKQHPRYSENPPSRMFHSHLAVGLTSTEILGFQLESVTDSHWAVSLWDTNMFQAGPGPARSSRSTWIQWPRVVASRTHLEKRPDMFCNKLHKKTHPKKNSTRKISEGVP